MNLLGNYHRQNEVKVEEISIFVGLKPWAAGRTIRTAARVMRIVRILSVRTCFDR